MSKYNSNIKANLKSVLYKCVNFWALSRPTIDNPALILNYHHILPSESIDNSLLNGYSHSTKSFTAQMKWLTNKYHRSTNFDDKNSFIVTFDDCSVSTYEEALPILDAYNLKAYFFIVENRLGTSLWIDDYFFWLSYIPESNYILFNKKFNISSKDTRLKTHLFLWRQYESGATSTEILHQLNHAYSFDNLKPLKKKLHKRLTTINKDQVQSLIQRGHMVGFHSQNHELLSLLDENALLNECRTKLNHLYNCNVFAIPFGDISSYNNHVLNVIRSMNHEHILLNHSTKPSNTTYGRLNLPDTHDTDIIEYRTRRYLKYIS